MVMYRDFVRRSASSMDLVGFVKNENDGSVVVVAEGEAERLHNLLDLLHKGPVLAKVKSVDFKWAEPSNVFKSFNIIY